MTALVFRTPSETKKRIEDAKESRIQAAREALVCEVRRIIDAEGAGRLNVASFFAERLKKVLDAYTMQGGASNAMAGLVCQPGLVNKSDDYADVRKEAAIRVHNDLNLAGWDAVFQKWEEVLYWRWPAEAAEPTNG